MNWLDAWRLLWPFVIAALWFNAGYQTGRRKQLEKWAKEMDAYLRNLEAWVQRPCVCCRDGWRCSGGCHCADRLLTEQG